MESKKDEKLRNLFLVLFVLFFTSSACFLLICVGFYNVLWLVLTILCFIVSVICAVFARLKYKGYQLKKIFSKKEFYILLNESLKKFPNAPDDFIKPYVKARKKVYEKTGKLFYDANCDWIYRNEENKNRILKVFGCMKDAIKSKGGFVEFCNHLKEKGKNGETESSWFAYSCFNTDLVSGELNYLMAEVYRFSDFCVTDIGYSEEFTKKNNETIRILNEKYTLMLFAFEQEISDAYEKIKGNIKK